jgi:uncharacterized zinc-type alcohol dehydrogenase-like protein
LARYARPTDRVGIIGIGGLGHLAVKFAAAFGCDVTAFTSSQAKPGRLRLRDQPGARPHDER